MRFEKEIFRRDAIKLKIVGRKSYREVQQALTEKYGKNSSIRTLKWWMRRVEEGWNLIDLPKRPKTIHRKITQEIELRVVELRDRSGWEAYKLRELLSRKGIKISESSVNDYSKVQLDKWLKNEGHASEVGKMGKEASQQLVAE